MERLQRQKEEKEREIENIVARAVVPSPGPSYQEANNNSNSSRSSTPEPSPAENGMGEVERRLKRLEKNGDAWLRVMGPLLENMTKTLDAMHGDGMCSDLTMSDFMIDMEAEARRFSLMGQNVPAALLQAAATQGESSLGSLNGTTTRQQSASPSPSSSGSGGKERKKVGRGRSSSSLGRLRLQLDRAAKKSLDLTSSRHATTTTTTEYDAPQDSAKSGLGLGYLTPRTSSAAGAARPVTPRSPQEHDFEVEMAIRQRIKKQEAEFNELMNKWNSSAATPGMRSRRPSVVSSSGGGDDHSGNGKPGIPPLELPQSVLGNNSSSEAEASVDPMLEDSRGTSWPKKAPSLDMLNPPPPPVAAGLGRRRSNTDLGPGGAGGEASGMENLSPLMRDLRGAALLEY
ncbi:hypothetical protein UCREL1_10609 [Eutypa lata UCREL1]|uniref:Uncharacterized protein n=1 Tax=Eutypa lata (strain UCR-EL1) TaxID=1287681 RepID=M7SE63_EUTLA|nr:hypothetical protein UCREL1_10609 [Eutypa lata UCREL1]